MSDADERLIVMLEARIAEFEKRMGQAERRGTRTYTGLARNSKSATRQMEADMLTATARINAALASTSAQMGAFGKAFIAGALTAAVGGLAQSARGAVRSMADLADQADRMGLDVETFQGLQAGLALSGVAAKDAAASIENFAQRLGDAAGGQGELLARLEKSGVSIRNQAGELRSTVDVLKDYADLVAAAPNAAERMALVTDAFGKGGKAMVLAMGEGAAGIDQMIAQAREAGVVIEESMIRQAAKLDDQFDLVAQQISTTWKTAVIEAAEFFGFIEERQLAFFRTSENFEAVLDKFGTVEAAAAIAGGWQELEQVLAQSDALERLEQMRLGFEQFQEGIGRGTMVMTGDLKLLSGEFPVLAEALSGMIRHAYDLGQELQAALDAGDVEAAQKYSAELKIAVDHLEKAMTGADELSTLDLSGAVSWASDLATAFGSVAAAARDAVAAASGMGAMDTGTPLSGDVSGMMPPSVGGVTSSPRPKSAPPMVSEGALPPGSRGGRGGGGGGGGSTRIEALLADLQTEREILAAWYEESLELVNSATDAQLEALGGRHETLERLDAALTVHEALSALPEHCQEILDRFFACDESYQTIGDALAIAPGTIASRISRCLKKLRAQLEGRSEPSKPSGER